MRLRREVSFLALYVISIAVLSPRSFSVSNEFLDPPQYNTGNKPSGLAIADFNGDGNLDVATADSGANQVSVLLGTASGGLRSRMDFSSAAHPSSIVAGDFNGDGKLDLAVTAQSAQAVSVLLGNGDGTFQAHVEWPVGSAPNAMVAADFNGDGNLDLAVTNSASNAIGVLLGNGDGTFRPQLSQRVGSQPSSIASGDFNRDGNPDLVVMNTVSGNTSVLLGNGDGSFQKPLDYYTGAAYVAVADLNGDGILDWIVSNFYDEAIVYLGIGDGTFQVGTTVKDQTGSGLAGLAIGDFNADGKLDLALSDYSSMGVGMTVGVALGNGDGTFGGFHDYAVGFGPLAIGGADLDHDGTTDLVVANQTSDSVSVLLANRTGVLRARPVYPIPLNTAVVAVADVNNDGNPDLISGLDIGDIGISTASVVLGTGKGGFSPHKEYYGGSGGAGGLAVADFNEDGNPDIALSDRYGNTISILLGSGDGTFHRGMKFAAGSAPEGMVAADFNGDGHTDIAAANSPTNTQGSVTVLLGNGDGTFQPAEQYNAGSHCYTVAAGDLNNDGKMDLVVNDPGDVIFSDLVSVLLGNGDGTFQPHVDYRTDTEPTTLNIGDLNRDGNLDIVVGTSKGIVILLGNGDGTFQRFVEYLTPQVYAVALADFNGDAILDLAVGTADSEDVAIMDGNGDGTFQGAVNFPVSGDNFALAAGTFTRDQAPDLAAFGFGETFTLLVNKGFH